MKVQLRYLVAAIVLTVAALTTSQVALSQAVMQRSANVQVDICPAPELVNTNIVLDQNHPNVDLSVTIRRGPVIGRIPGTTGPSGPQVIPVEPQSSDEVLSEFDPNYGLNIAASEFLFAQLTTYGMIRCHYNSDRIEPSINIQTNSTTCSIGPGPWTSTSANSARCDGSRRSCTFRCGS